MEQEDADWEYFEKYGEDRKNRKGRYSKNAFMEGVVYGFTHNLRIQDMELRDAHEREHPEQNRLPVLLQDPLLEEKYQNHYNPSTWNTGSGGSNGGGHSEGNSVGKKIVVRKAVNRGAGNTKRMITA
jgi:hypothetical protein